MRAAAVAATWLLPDEASTASRQVYVRLRKGTLDLHAPELWLWQCGNIIAKGIKRGRLSGADALLTWSVLDAIRGHVELASPASSPVHAALVLALEHGLSLYDAAYLWLAVSLKLPLLSHDKPLRRAATKSAVAVVTLEDLA